ncbi:transmembrane protease serine 2-like [Mustelus asterias]
MSFINYTGGGPYMSPKYSQSTNHIFQEYTSPRHHPPLYNVFEPPIYGGPSFNRRSFIAVPAKRKNLLIGLIAGGVLFSLGVISTIVWYFISTSNCIPCGKHDECVSPSQWCDGIPQCHNGRDEECFLLANSNFVLYAKTNMYGWRPVCHDNWNLDHGKQVCNRIGYARGSYSDYGSTSASNVQSSEFLILNESLKTQNTYQKLSISKNCSSGLLVTLRCIDCGVRQYRNHTSARIVGGMAASKGEFPWQVSLHFNKRHVCGGSIIAPYWVITAAHCGERHPYPSQWRVYGGILQQIEISPQMAHSVEKFIRHENFNKRNKDYDVALMKLKTPFQLSETIQPICLPNYGQEFLTSVDCWISGWGDLEEAGIQSTNLQKTIVPLIAHFDCKVSYYEFITSRMLCAGLREGGVDACQGDSGGPLVTNQKSLWWLVGITSWGYGCARPGNPGVYSRVPTMLDWIYLQLKANTSLKLDKFASISVVREGIENKKGRIDRFDSSSFLDAAQFPAMMAQQPSQHYPPPPSNFSPPPSSSSQFP